MHISRPSRFAIAAVLVALVGCTNGSEGEPSEPVVSEETAPTADAEPTPPDTDADADADDPDGGATGAPPDGEGPPPLTGEPATEPAQSDPDWGGPLAVTDVRVAAHDGFDRVVFDIAGDDGAIGWDVRYVDVPTSQGSGHEAEVAGAAYLAVSISGVALPPELPADVEAFTGNVDGPADGAVVEVVHDSIFEGYHLFFVGLDREVPYVVERLDDPQRLVIDLHHG